MAANAAVFRSAQPHRLALPPMLLVPWFVVTTAVALTLVHSGPVKATLLVVGVAVVSAVALYPPIGAWMLLGLTPLVVGISRGGVTAALRPNEALLVLVAVGLVCRFLVVRAERDRLRPSSIDWAILMMSITSSIVPLVWMRIRGWSIAHDDILYSLQFWKLYLVYLVFRVSVTREREVRICLWVSLASATGVAVVGILEALHIAGVREFLASNYTSYDNTGAASAIAAASNRGASTLGLPIAVADLLTMNFAIALGMIRIGTRHTRLLAGLAALFTIGVFAAGEFSGVIGFYIALIVIALVTGKRHYLGRALLVTPIAMYAVWPVIQTRLEGFSSPGGLPVSWQGRLSNLHTYFWPRLFSGDSWVLGLRPAARVIVPSQDTGYVWIESGYTWLLWAGGLPLLFAYVYFVVAAIRHNRHVMRTRHDSVAVAAAAIVVALCLISVLMVIDPHIAYRGSADLLFALLGLTSAGAVRLRGSSDP